MAKDKLSDKETEAESHSEREEEKEETEGEAGSESESENDSDDGKFGANFNEQQVEMVKIFCQNLTLRFLLVSMYLVEIFDPDEASVELNAHKESAEIRRKLK